MRGLFVVPPCPWAFVCLGGESCVYSRTVSTARGVDVDSTSKQSRGRHAGEAKFMEEDMFGIPLLRLQGGSGYRQSSWPSWRPFREPYWAASPSGEAPHHHWPLTAGRPLSKSFQGPNRSSPFSVSRAWVIGSLTARGSVQL